jgi:hypothetical protein
LKFNKKLETDYQTYLEKFDLQVTKEEYRIKLREVNPNAMKNSLENYLKQFFFDIEVSVSESDLKVQVKDRGNVELGVITSHYVDFPMLYSVSTHDAVKLLSHVWYSYEDGFDLACMTGYWDFPEKFEGSDVLNFEQPIPQITSVQFRTSIEEVFITNKGAGKRVYLEKLEHLHELSKVLDWLSCSNYVELPNLTWVSSLEVLPYTSESTINNQVCVRPFIEVEVI